MRHLEQLRAAGRMQWDEVEQAWIAAPEDVVAALAQDGFEEYKREVAHNGRGRVPTGGLWQGLDSRTGAIASAIWVTGAEPRSPIVFIAIDGRTVSA